MAIVHIPVMLMETIDGLKVKPGGTYIDATYGGGGHASEILRRLGDGRLFAFDADEEAIAGAPEDKRLFPVHANFREMSDCLEKKGVRQVDGMVADLGVSSCQLETAHRGFSYKKEGALDMRMGRGLNALTAARLVNNYPEVTLKRIFREYGELSAAGKLASTIVRARGKRALKTTQDLLGAIAPCIPASGRYDFLSRVFQALRMEVNGEPGALAALLRQAKDLLIRGGCIAVISYHSLEDRMVKRFFRFGNAEGIPEQDLYGASSKTFDEMTPKPIRPSPEEVDRNPRARSAKLRIAQKK